MATKNKENFRLEPSPHDKYLPYSYHITDKVVTMRNGELLTIFKIDGKTHDCASDKDLITWHEDLNMLVRSISSNQLEFWSYEWHHEAKDYPDGDFSGFFQKYLDSYNKRLHENKNQLVTDLFLALVYKPVGDKAQKFFSKFEKPSVQDIEAMQAESLESLEEITDQVLTSLSSYGIKQLGVYYRNAKGEIVEDDAVDNIDIQNDATDEDVGDDIFDDGNYAITPKMSASGSAFAYTEVGEFLYFLANAEWCHLPVCNSRLSEYMMDNRVTFSLWGDTGLIRSVDKKTYTTAIEVRDYNKVTEPGQFNLLKEAPFEYLLAQSFCCYSDASSATLIDRQEKSLIETKDRGQSQLDQLSTALDALISKEIVFGESHSTIHVFDENERELQKKARKIKVMLSQCGTVGGVVGLASEAAYFGKMPGNLSWAPRPVPINSWNFLHFSPFHNFLRGKESNNPWGPAVTMFRTISGSPLFFNFHITPLDELSYNKRPLGHTLLTGKSGEGKTTLQNFLLTQSMKFKPRIYAYDIDRGMEPFIRSVGGYYKVLSSGVPTGFAPLTNDPTPRNISIVKTLMRVCFEITNNGPLSKDNAIELNQAIDALMGEHSVVPRQERSVTHLKGFITDEYLLSLANEWTQAGEYGWVFDNPVDSLDLSVNDVFGFDLSDFISAEGEIPNPAKTPILMYLLFRVRDSIDGTRRVIQAFDEFHRYLDDTVTVKEIKRGIKTDRKKDAVYLFSTQEPKDALSSSIGNTVISQTVTKICLRDNDAVREYYSFLSDSEFRAHQSIPELSREMLVKQGNKSTIAKFDLKISNSDRDMKDMNKVLSILSGEPQNAAIAESMVEQYGDEPEVWLNHYWEKTV